MMKTTPLRTMSVTWAAAVSVLACTQAIAPYLPNWTGVGVPIGGDRNGVPDPPLVPAGYAFSIWGIIFLGSLVIGVMLFTQSWRRDRAIGAMTPWFAGAMLACTMWSIVASYSDGVFGIGWWGLSIPNFVVLLLCLLAAINAYGKHAAEGRESAGPLARVVVCITLGLFAGWSTAATFANIAAWAASAPMRNFGFAEINVSLGLLCAAGVVSVVLLLTVARTWKLPMARAAYAGAIAWALAAIAVKNMQDERGLALLAIGIAVVVGVLGVVPKKGVS